VVAHRRYHPGFQRARQLVGDVYRRTGCPVTSVTAEYGDGEWRMPWEVRNQTYHPFRLGYGMLCHSGYHAFDAAAWLAEAGHGPRHRPDSIEAVTHLVLPADLDTQLDQHTLETVFGDLPSSPKVAPTRRPLGEIDAHALIAMRRGDRVITTLGIHAIHNSLSARAWPSSAGRNLYTGNGRVKQEIYSVHQGPFQALKLLVWQSAPDQEGAVPDLYSIGGDRHFELHVFRNQALFPDWEAYERFDLSDLETVSYDDLLVGPGKVAIMSEFLGAVTGRVDRNALRSDLRSHRTATAMLSATYQSQCASVAGGRTTGVTVPLEGGHGRRGLSLAAAG
jgi:predicted dehydrogenase